MTTATPREPVTPQQPETTELTEREHEVLLLISQGLVDTSIARRLQRSPHSIMTRKTRLFRKLGVSDRAHAVRVGFERGLLVAGPRGDADELSGLDIYLLELISLGLSNKEISTRTQLTESTAKAYFNRNLYPRLRATCRAHAVRRGFELGVLAAGLRMVNGE